MSRTNKSIVFLALAFAISWAVVIGGWAMGWRENPQLLTVVLALSMFGPGIAAFICVMAFEKGRRVDALGLRFRPNLWWLVAYAAPILLAAASVALTVWLGGRAFVDPGAAVIALTEQTAPEQVESVRALGADVLGLLVLAQALVFGALINSLILTFSEELGWRGYLHDLWRGAGFWRASLSTGAVWGLWHAPAIYLLGHNYPDNPELGVVLFVAFCTLLAPILTFIRDGANSVWAAGIFHGVFNAVGGLTVITVSNPTFPWNGIVGIGGFVALAIAVAVIAVLRRRDASGAPANAPT